MNNTCLILVIFIVLASSALSSYLDIPPPPERPLRFKTKEQIESYLKAVKDYYDAFKIKLVRRGNFLDDYYSSLDDNSNSIENDDLYSLLNQSPRSSYIRRRYKTNRFMNNI